MTAEKNRHASTGGVFITFEGGEGAGKSTQIRHLERRLVEAGRRVLVTREPGGSHFAEAVRDVLLSPDTAPLSPLASALAFYAARADHLDAKIRPALADGAVVLCDRFSDSTRAYQGAAGGVDATILEAIDKIAVGATQPDLTILLDLDPSIGLARAQTRRATAQTGAFIVADAFEGRQLEFHQKLRQGFLALARAEAGRFAVVDAFRNELTIADDIWRIVSARFRIAHGETR